MVQLDSGSIINTYGSETFDNVARGYMMQVQTTSGKLVFLNTEYNQKNLLKERARAVANRPKKNG